MDNQKLRLSAELPPPEYALVQEIQRRLGFVASASLTCFLFRETPHLAGISPTEVEFIETYASSMNVALPERKLQDSLIRYPRRE